jgi:predicted permease
VSVITIMCLAIGIGGNTAMFSVVNGLLIRQLPVRDAGRLVMVTDETTPGIRTYAMPVWEQLWQHRSLFEGVLAWSPTEFNLTSRGEREPADGVWVSGSFFDTLGLAPLLGRGLAKVDDQIGNGRDGLVTVISHAFWQRRFGAAPDAVGRTLTLDGVVFTIVGITPPAFTGLDVGRTFDVMVPFAAMPRLGVHEYQPGVRIMGRLKPGQTRAGASLAVRQVQPAIRAAALPRVATSRWRAQDRDAYLREGFVLAPGGAGASRLRQQYERPLLTLLGMVALVLLIACGNIANLLLARAAMRQREFRIRMALGAGRWRLVRARLVESLTLAAAGAALGVALASWGSRLLVRYLSTPSNPIQLDVSIDGSVLIFATAVTVIATLLFGVAPAVRAASDHEGGALTTRNGSALGSRPGGPAGALLIGQVALSVVLIVGAGLFVRTLTALLSVPLGFEPDRVLLANVSTDGTRVGPEQRVLLFERTQEVIRSVAGVADAAWSFLTPVSGPILLRPVELEDAPGLPERQRQGSVNVVSPGWFHTLGTPIVAGREFTQQDRIGAPAVVVVNESFVRQFLSASPPLGRTITFGIVGPNPASAEVVGVAADAIYESLRSPAPPTMYFPLAQLRPAPPGSLTMTIRVVQGPSLAVAKSVAAAIRTVNPDLALTFRPLADQISTSILQERALATLSGFFGGVAVLLSALGLFGVTSYSVSRRRREIGIRVALGATRGAILRLVLARVSVLVSVGLAIGAGISLWASPLAASLLFGLEPRDPATLVSALLLMASISLLAALRPALHAASVDPAVVLRTE